MSKEFKFTPHFPREDVACHCCGKIGPYPETLRRLLDKLEKLRHYIGDRPINVTCMYRCPKHNRSAEVGSFPGSPHELDQAADIWVDGMSVEQLARAAEEVGFGGVGRYANFVHVDVGAPGRRW